MKGETSGLHRTEGCFFRWRKERLEDTDPDYSFSADPEDWERTPCFTPPPEMGCRETIVWMMFKLSEGGTAFAGMDGVPRRRAPSEVEAVARALGVSWDERTLVLYRMVEDEWLQMVDAQVKESRKKV